MALRQDTAMNITTNPQQAADERLFNEVLLYCERVYHLALQDDGKLEAEEQSLLETKMPTAYRQRLLAIFDAATWHASNGRPLSELLMSATREYCDHLTMQMHGVGKRNLPN
jgi:hypothetical protein